MSNPPIRVSVSEAAKLLGITQKTIRLAIKKQEIKYIVVRSRYKINFASLVEWSQKSQRRKTQFYHQGIGQYATNWQINNRKYSPSEKLIKKSVD